MEKILIVDDDYNIAELLKIYLEKEKYETVLAHDGMEAITLFEKEQPDIVLLDVMLPKLDGWQVCRRLRENSLVPIIMLTAKGETFDKVLGFDIGCDDYIVKPFDAKEVVARVKAVLRRTMTTVDIKKEIVYDNLSININNYVMLVNGEQIDTPPKELELIYHLAGHPNRVYTRNQLLDEVWGFDYYGDPRTVDSHIKRLRAKLDKIDHPQWNIKTIWGVGYKFEIEGQ